MSPQRTRRRAPLGSILALAVLALLAAAAYPLLRDGELEVPFTGRILRFGGEAQAATRDDGRVPVVMAARAIEAYARVDRNDLIDPRQGDFAVMRMSPDRIEREGILTDLSQIVGRVMARDKRPGFVFTERDFLPVGTRPGITAGIPEGKRGVRLEANDVQGLVELNAGDRFDLLATLPVETKPPGQANALGGAFAAQSANQAALEGLDRQARVSVLVQNGTIVSPMRTRAVPTSNASLTRGQFTSTRPVQEVVIAVSPEEVAPLMEALAIGAKVVSVPRSGRPGDPIDSVTPERKPRSPFEHRAGGFVMVETFDSSGRRMVAVPRGENVPQ